MKKLSNDQISTLCRELSYLMHAGMGNADALSLMTDEGGASAELLKEMAKEADEGTPLFEIFEKSGVFPAYCSNLLMVGERSGKTEETLSALADNYEGQEKLNRQLRTSLLYPMILLLIMLVVIVVLLVYVLPIFDRVYAQFGVTLTGIAGGLLSFGQFLGKAMPVLCAILGIAIIAAILLTVSPKARESITSRWKKNHGDKGVLKQVNDARFSMALSMGLKSGMPIEEALTLAGQIQGEIPGAKERIEKCVSDLEDGKELAKALEESSLLPKTECRLLAAGLRSGVGDEAMDQITERMRDRSELAISEKVSRVEPTLVILTSLLVGMILLAVMLPLMNIMSTIG